MTKLLRIKLDEHYFEFFLLNYRRIWTLYEGLLGLAVEQLEALNLLGIKSMLIRTVWTPYKVQTAGQH